jgi:hypothetical protein
MWRDCCGVLVASGGEVGGFMLRKNERLLLTSGKAPTIG